MGGTHDAGSVAQWLSILGSIPGTKTTTTTTKIIIMYTKWTISSTVDIHYMVVNNKVHTYLFQLYISPRIYEKLLRNSQRPKQILSGG